MTRPILDMCLRCQGHAHSKTTQHRYSAQNLTFIPSMASSCPFFFQSPLIAPTDLSIFPASTPQLSIPTLVLNIPSYITFSLGSALAFFVLYTLTAYRYKIGKIGGMFDSRGMQKLIAFLGVLGILIGTSAFNLVCSIF